MNRKKKMKILLFGIYLSAIAFLGIGFIFNYIPACLVGIAYLYIHYKDTERLENE